MILSWSEKPKHHLIGGKAKGLYFLKEGGFLVPDFITVCGETFASALNESPLNEDALSFREQVLKNFVLPIQDISRIRQQLEKWNFPTEPVVVRSSIIDEDGDTDAFAGMMDSFLHIATYEELEQKIRLCAASAYSQRAIAYRKQKNLTLHALPAVIIQRQINADVSGVIFSTYPEYPQEMAIHSVSGLAEGLVGGKLDPNEFYLNKQSGTLIESVIADDCRSEEKEGAAISHISAKVLDQLFYISEQIERRKGKPQDIEFAIADELVYLVQCRPITQKIPEIVIYDNSNIQESYCGVTTPLTFSFARRAYATVYTQTMNILGLPQSVVKAKQELVNNLLGLVKGRVYYNINNWYKGLQLLPSFRQNKEDMERMMGLEDPVDFIVSREKTIIEKVGMVPRLLNFARLYFAFGKLKQLTEVFHSDFRKIYGEFYQQDLDRFSLMQLWEQKLHLDGRLLHNWTTPIINDFFVMMTNGKVLRNFNSIGIDNAEQFLGLYLSGVQRVESIKPIEGLQELAKIARANRDLKLYLSQETVSLSYLKNHYKDFYEKALEYLEEYGDRIGGELKLETKTMRTDPDIFLRHLRNYLSQVHSNLSDTSSFTHERAKLELGKQLQHSTTRKRQSLLRNLEKLQQAIQARESMRLERTRLFGMYRTIYLAIAGRLINEGKLLNTDDIFYLEECEIEKAIKSDHNLNLANLVAQRKIEFERYKTEELPSRYVHPSRSVKVNTEGAETGTWVGKACLGGSAEGEVVVIRDARTDVDVAGKIICALRTDPGWALIFPSCKGVVIEKGSALSHSVILLRELQIPTIINIPNISTSLKSGMRIRMNADTGEINVLKDED